MTHSARALAFACTALLLVAAGGGEPSSRVDGFTVRTPRPVVDLAVDGATVAYRLGDRLEPRCPALESWRVGEPRVTHRVPSCHRSASFYGGLAVSRDQVAWTVSHTGREPRSVLAVASTTSGAPARTVASAPGTGRRVGRHLESLAGDGGSFVFVRQRTVDPGEGTPYGAGWTTHAHDGEHVTRIGAGGGSVGFGSASGVSFRDGLLAVLWDRGRLVSLQRIGEQRLRPLRLGPVPGRHDVAQSRHVVVDEDVVAVYDGATRLLRTYDVDTRRLVTRVRLREEFAFAELAAVDGGVAVFTNALDEPPISLVDLSSGTVAALAVEGIDRSLPDPRRHEVRWPMRTTRASSCPTPPATAAIRDASGTSHAKRFYAFCVPRLSRLRRRWR